MTKRKLKKLLMAGGLQRNEARQESNWLWRWRHALSPSDVVSWGKSREPSYRKMRHGAQWREPKDFRWYVPRV